MHLLLQNGGFFRDLAYVFLSFILFLFQDFSSCVYVVPAQSSYLALDKDFPYSHWTSPHLFNLYVAYIMQNAKLDEAQAGIKIAGRNINNLRYADDTILNGRK